MRGARAMRCRADAVVRCDKLTVMRIHVLALTLAACASAPQVRRFEPTDRAAITAGLDQQVAAWNRGDLPRYMDGYAHIPGLVFTSGGNVRRGWQDAFDHYKARY